MTAPAVGIDLGTTNSVIAVSTGGRPQVLTDASGSPLIPSVVSFLEDGTRLVGRTARQRRAIDPRNTVYSVKRLLGRPFKSEEVRRARSRMPFELKEGPDSAVLVATRSGDLALPELSAMVLREVRRVGEEALGDKVEKCVITVPANFNELQRSSTKVAGRVAELEVIRILNEPTAAALAYGYGRGTKEKICIFDFGGGTFDVTLLELSGNVFEVLATAGDTFLGGDDIDVAVTDSLVQNFQRATKLDPLQDRILYDVMRDAVEMAKCQLSTEEVAKVNVDFSPLTGGAPVRFHHTLSRDDLERLAAPFISRTFDVCTEALKLAGLRATDLTAVILVGGSTRIPSVRSRVASFFGRDPLTRLAPEEVVGLGASILAEALGGARRNQPTRPAANRVTASHASQPPPMNALRGNTMSNGVPSQSVPPGGVPSAGVPGVEPSNPGTARNTLTGIGDDSGLKTMPRMPSMAPGGSPLRAPTPPPIPAAAMRQTSPTIAPAVPSGPQPTPSSAGFELDDPFADHGGAQHPRPPVGERTMAIESSDALGALDEPSFMGRIPKGAGSGALEGPELGARTMAAPVSAFNLDDPSLMAPNPTLMQPAAHDDAWESPPAKPPIGAAPKPRGPLRIGPPQRLDAPQAPPVQTPAEARQTFGMDPDVAARLPPSIAAAMSPPPAASAASVFGDTPEIPKGPTETSVPSFTLDEPTQAFMHEAPKPATREVSVPSFALDEPTQAFMSAGSAETSVPSFRLDEPTQAVDTSGFNFNTGLQAKGTTEVSVPAFRIDADDIFGKGAPGETTTAMAAPSSALIVPPPLAGGAPAGPSRGPSGQGLPDALSTLKGVAPAPSRTMPAPGPLPTLPPATGNRPQPPMQQASPVSSPPAPRSMPPGMGAPLLLDVTPFSLGVETAGGLCETVIARNATIPVEQTRNFATTHDNQTAVVIRVAQGESRMFKENQGLGELELAGLRPALRGEVVIAVTFELEADGTMRIRAREVASGLEQAVRVNLLTMPSEAAQVEMMNRSRQGVAATAG